MGNDSSGGAVKTFVNETGKFLANIPGETNELLSGESETRRTILWVDKGLIRQINITYFFNLQRAS